MLKFFNKILPPPPNLLKIKYFKVFTRGYSLVELLTVVGVLGALSTVAVTQFGKYKKTAQERTLDATTTWDTANCINAPDINQCYCEKGLAELVGLKPNDCCPEGQVKSMESCVTLQASNTQTMQNSGNDGNKESNDDDSDEDEEEAEDDPSGLPTCDPNDLKRGAPLRFGEVRTCICPEGRKWSLKGRAHFDGYGQVYFYKCVCHLYQYIDPNADCFARPRCPSGTSYSPSHGGCITNPLSCPNGQERLYFYGACVSIGSTTQPSCPEGQEYNHAGRCYRKCPPGKIHTFRGTCFYPSCPIGQTRNSESKCVWTTSSCPEGQKHNFIGNCAPTTCADGQFLHANGNCYYSHHDDPFAGYCSAGLFRTPQGTCVSPELDTR